jgi:hypothetical protein
VNASDFSAADRKAAGVFAAGYCRVSRAVPVATLFAATLFAATLFAATTGIALAQQNLQPPAAAAQPAAPTAQGPARPAPDAAQSAPQSAAQPAPASTAEAPSAGLALPPQPSPSGAAAPATTPGKPGFFDDLARWWNDSVADFNAKVKAQQSKLEELNKQSTEAAKNAAAATQQAMKNAADAVVRSATSKVIEIHEPCAIAGNGAADCATAAANACKGKGFADGQPLDVRTAEKCNASLWLQGPQKTAADCPVETVVLRAACQ